MTSYDIGIELVKNETHSALCAFLRANCILKYPRLLLLVLIFHLVPIGSAECQCLFSLMNRIKTDLRSRMRIDRINGIMTANRMAPGLGALALEELDEWISFRDSGCKTGRYTPYHK